ncbi:MAG: hypothetical protein IPL59_20575 [Candidatus Competibacteraceae bacterium]|nr:hypothetical protein [Candidatus Competibacteraceae bacterium]
MIDNILFLNRIYTPAIPKEPLKMNMLPDLEADLLKAAQTTFIKDKKKN